ncbi:MAG TPA: 16S rRNA (cytidine(1402)-2'-O)-methyltransferase [Candidatus Paceibacterota bacterium]
MSKSFDIAHGKLSMVATPIGNLEDVTLRALRTLKEADVVFAEDTRVAAKLLARYEIQVSVHRLDAEVETKVALEIVERLGRGEQVAYITDAGTPGISDPGSRLVSKVRAQLPEIPIEAIPGASALTAALSVAGVDAAQFIFLGFLPHKKGRQTALKDLATSEYPVVLYESTHRILKLLQELIAYAPQRRVTVLRELTKMYEEVLAGSPAELLATLTQEPQKQRGEFVVIVEGE